MDPIINLKNITVAFRESIALDNVSLKVYQGEHVVIAGPNGSGKTTLLTVINGLCRICSGMASVFGIGINYKTAPFIRSDIGYVPQLLTVDPRFPMRVKEVVLLGRLAQRRFCCGFSRTDEQLLKVVAEQIGISHLLDRPIGHLSGGEQKKVAIARALIQQPKILLLDEPNSNLDMNAQDSILKLIDTVHAERNITTIIVMHDLGLVPLSCRRMILLKNSQIFFDGTLYEAMNEKVLSGLYGISITVRRNDNVGVRTSRISNND